MAFKLDHTIVYAGKGVCMHGIHDGWLYYVSTVLLLVTMTHTHTHTHTHSPLALSSPPSLSLHFFFTHPPSIHVVMARSSRRHTHHIIVYYHEHVHSMCSKFYTILHLQVHVHV